MASEKPATHQSVPVQRVPLAGQVVDGLLDLIRAANLRPGDLLPSQHELARRFGVSRPVLREAMTTLVARGVLDVRNGKGAIVRPLSSDPCAWFFQRAASLGAGVVAELMEMRQGLEVHAARLAAVRRLPAQADELRRTVAEMRRHLDDTDLYNELDLRLHLTIAAATQNDVIRHLMGSLQETLLGSMREGYRQRRVDDVLLHSQELHEDVVQTIVDGDAESAGRAMERHFHDTLALLRGETAPRRAVTEV